EANSQLAPRMLVRVEIKPGKKKGKTLFFPKDAIVRTPKETSVWVVREDKDKSMKAHKVVVQTGRLEKSLVAVRFKGKKIKPGEWVVVQGNERLKSNSKVKIINTIP
ncbi:MAG: hypothetical protein O6857_01745, partial [Nitrospinae bacterium]|nr:hypothetical protein [Nitrospinota bacterium]